MSAVSELWVITIGKDCPIMSVAKEVTQAGLSIKDTLPEIRVILAEGSEDIASKVRALDGVTDVSRWLEASIV